VAAAPQDDALHMHRNKTKHACQRLHPDRSPVCSFPLEVI
jgi:hypothetical protein